MLSSEFSARDKIPDSVREFISRRLLESGGIVLIFGSLTILMALASWSAQDPSINFSSDLPVRNWLGKVGAIISDLLMQTVGIASISFALITLYWGWCLISRHRLSSVNLKVVCLLAGNLFLCAFLALLPVTDRWPLPVGLGGIVGDGILSVPKFIFGDGRLARFSVGIGFAALALLLLRVSTVQEGPNASDENLRVSQMDEDGINSPPEIQVGERPVNDPHGEPGIAIVFLGAIAHIGLALKGYYKRLFNTRKSGKLEAPGFDRRVPKFDFELPDRELLAADKPRPNSQLEQIEFSDQDIPSSPVYEDMVAPATREEPESFSNLDSATQNSSVRIVPAIGQVKQGKRVVREAQVQMWDRQNFEFPPLALLGEPKKSRGGMLSIDALEQNARLLEGVLEDFGVKGEIINVRPGPVVTLYELEPAPGVKSSRVIGLADDIARSMSAISARVAVVQGRNAIGIELPNQKRETVFLRELLASDDYERSKQKLAICLGKTIGGEPVLTDLARMPHLLVAGTTGSGKSVAINTMILSLLYRLHPEQCKLIMIDPKMLELSVYDGIPHLLTPVVTDPKKAVMALKWAVKEMEDRYRKMSKLGVRNIDGYNSRVGAAVAKGEKIAKNTQTGFDRATGEAVFEEEELDLTVLPFIVIIVDEMADLMMVAGKDIEGAIQRLAQMARAAGIHLIMATQRPSVDVITGTIKANFPTRISFQVTSKIDSRTILGEQGAEQLLGQGDMLYMAGGGRISRVHGPFVTDQEVEEIVSHLKAQGQPEYMEDITLDDEDVSDEDSGENSPDRASGEGVSLYDKAVAIVLRDQKCSTSYIQRRLSIGYNKAASIVEQMENNRVVSPANHAGKREILLENPRRDEAYEMEYRD